MSVLEKMEEIGNEFNIILNEFKKEGLKELTMNSCTLKNDMENRNLIKNYKKSKDEEKTKDQTLKVLKLKPEYYKYVPKKLISLEILELLKEMKLDGYVFELLKKIKDLKFLTKCILELKYKNTQFSKFDKEVCKEYLKEKSLSFIPFDWREDIELATYALKKRSDDILHIELREGDEISENLVLLAATLGARLKNIPKMFWTKDLIIECLSHEKNRKDIKIIPFSLMSKALCEMVFYNDVELIKFIPKCYLTKQMCEYAFMKNAFFMNFFPQKFITKNMCDIAYKKEKNLEKFFPKKFKRNVIKEEFY